MITIPDEKVTPAILFFEDCKEKKKNIPHYASKLKNHEYTPKELEKLNGSVVECNLNKPLDWLQFKNLSKDIQKMYLINLADTFAGISVKSIRMMLHCSDDAIKDKLNEFGLMRSFRLRVEKSDVNVKLFDEVMISKNIDNNPIEDIDFDKPMELKEFMYLNFATAKKYIETLISKYKITLNDIAEMFHIYETSGRFGKKVFDANLRNDLNYKGLGRGEYYRHNEHTEEFYIKFVDPKDEKIDINSPMDMKEFYALSIEKQRSYICNVHHKYPCLSLDDFVKMFKGDANAKELKNNILKLRVRLKDDDEIAEYLRIYPDNICRFNVEMLGKHDVDDLRKIEIADLIDSENLNPEIFNKIRFKSNAVPVYYADFSDMTKQEQRAYLINNCILIDSKVTDAEALSSTRESIPLEEVAKYKSNADSFGISPANKPKKNKTTIVAKNKANAVKSKNANKSSKKHIYLDIIVDISDGIYDIYEE